MISDLSPGSFDSRQRERLRTLVPLMLHIRNAPVRGRAIAEASVACGLSAKRMRSLFDSWLREGDVALIERRALPRGRTAAADRLSLSADSRAILRQLALKCDSKQLAIEQFADDPRCPGEIRDLIATFRVSRNYPKALLAAAHVTPEERDQVRGHRRFQLRAYTQLRKLSYIDSTGTEHALAGGDLFECDDMSVNQPFWYEWPYGGDPLSDAYGVRLGRQMLACIDTATGKWLGFDLVGRVRDAYRAEDVVRFLGRIGSTHGLPRLGFRLEQGVWASRSIRGVKGASDDADRTTLGSIRDIVDIHYVHSPKAKGVIEGSFDFLQSLLSFSGVQIGRQRGEYERTTSLMLQCAAARRHPQDAGFPHISELAARIDAAMQQANARPKAGRLLTGIPQAKWDVSVAERPLALIPADRAHLFMPVKQIRPIDAGHVRCRVPHYGAVFSFSVPAEAAHLGRGYKLLVCFDPADPHAGAQVFDAETDRVRHFESAPDQSYGTWAFAPDAPQLDLREIGRSAPTAKKEFLAASRTAFRAVGMQVGTGASIDQVADGHGSSARIARGTRQENARLDHPAPRQGNARADALQARRDHVAGTTPERTARRQALEDFDVDALLVSSPIDSDADDDGLDPSALL